ncbi:hypothetical protein AB7M59_006707 [Bradyrhizobium elkanii]
MMGFASLYPSYESVKESLIGLAEGVFRHFARNNIPHASPTVRNVIRVNSDGRPSRKAKPGHSAVPLLT